MLRRLKSINTNYTFSNFFPTLFLALRFVLQAFISSSGWLCFVHKLNIHTAQKCTHGSIFSYTSFLFFLSGKVSVESAHCTLYSGIASPAEQIQLLGRPHCTHFWSIYENHLGKIIPAFQMQIAFSVQRGSFTGVRPLCFYNWSRPGLSLA